MSKENGRPRGTAKAPHGTDTDGIHPMTGKTGNKKMSRVLKGADKSRSPKGVTVPSKSRKGLAGLYF